MKNTKMESKYVIETLRLQKKFVMLKLHDSMLLYKVEMGGRCQADYVAMEFAFPRRLYVY